MIAPGRYARHHRHLIAVAAALGVNLLLVALLHLLVSPHGTAPPARALLRVVEFVRLKPTPRDPAPAPRTPPPAPPELAAAAPVPPALPAPRAEDDTPAAAASGITALEAPFKLSPLPALPRAPAIAPAGAEGAAESADGAGTQTGAGGAGGTRGPPVASTNEDVDVNLVPTYRVAPGYPARALRDGLEGVVTVEFTVDVEGRVRDPKILKAEPPGIFDAAVLNVMTQWRFNPKLVDGRAVARRARQDVRFNLHKP